VRTMSAASSGTGSLSVGTADLLTLRAALPERETS
jgi:hypothetical protein